MRSLVVVLLALTGYCHARPRFDAIARPSLVIDSYILGGVNADPAEFPWQLSQQRLGASWSHSCGASLLRANYALSAAHCVEGAATSVLRVVAGTNDRTDPNALISNVVSYKMHERYNQDPGTFTNDIAIITLANPINDNGGTIQFASLPDDNNDNFAGRIGTLSGWGRTSASNVLPTLLQKVDIGIIGTAECNQRMSSVSGAIVTDNMICVFDTASQKGSCSGDSGGPMNLNYPGAGDSRRVVAGVTSWGISSSSACLPSYPSVYTRTSTYLGWIATNTP